MERQLDNIKNLHSPKNPNLPHYMKMKSEKNELSKPGVKNKLKVCVSGVQILRLNLEGII